MKTVFLLCVILIHIALYAQAAAVSRRTKLIFCKPKKYGLAAKTAEIYFSASRRKNFSLNLHYDEIIFDSPGF